MLHHVSVGVSDVERSARFYDLVLAALGYKRVMEFLPHAVAYGETTPELWIQLPANSEPASVGNGAHIALQAPHERAVLAFHQAACAAGGTDEGAPGPRPEYAPEYFGAFIRDPDGNKIEAMLMVGAAASRPSARRAGKRAAARKSNARKGAKKPMRRTAATRKRPARGNIARRGRGRARKR